MITLVTPENVALILVIFAAQQVFSAISQPNRQAVIPRLLKQSDLAAASSLSMAVVQFGAISGPLIGGALIPLTGYPTLYFIDAALLFTTVWAAVRLPRLPRFEHDPPHSEVPSAGTTSSRSVIEGLRYVLATRLILATIAVDALAIIFAMPRALFPEIASTRFGGPDDGGVVLAALYASPAVGALLAGVFSGWFSQVIRQGMTISLSLMLLGVFICIFGVIVAFADGPALLMMFAAISALSFAGSADMVSGTAQQAMFHQSIPDQVRGRVQGILTIIGGPRIADSVHGAASATIGLVPALIGGGALAVSTVVAITLASRSLREYRKPAT